MDPIQSKLIYVDTRQLFDILNTAGAFRHLSVVFIGDSLEFWTHGKIFCSQTTIQNNLIWKQNTKDEEGYVPASGTLTNCYWGVPAPTLQVTNPEPQWIQFGTWDVNHGGTNKNTTSWASDLAEAGIEDIVLVSKTTGDDPVVSFSTLGTTGIINNNDRLILANDTNGIRWYSENLIHAGLADNATTADSLNHSLFINGKSFNGSEDIDAEVIDIIYGGTSKTAYSPSGSGINAWFEQSEFDVHTTSIKNKLVTITGESNGSDLTDINFNTTDIPTVASNKSYALINTNEGLNWQDLSVYLHAAAAMVFKGTVNCNLPSEITSANIEPKPLPWLDCKVGNTYVVTDNSFEVVYSGDTHGSYGQVDVGDLIICLQEGTETSPAQWSIVSNKVSHGVTYVGIEDPLWEKVYPEGSASQVDYVPVSNGTNPTQIYYNNSLYVDNDGWLHGKFYPDTPIPMQPVELQNYARWTGTPGLINFSAASGASASQSLVSLNNNNYVVRIQLDGNNLVYAEPAMWKDDITNAHTIYQIYELAANRTSAPTKLTYLNLNNMSNGSSKYIIIAGVGINDGFIGGVNPTVLLVAHRDYRDATTGLGGLLYSGQDSDLRSEVLNKLQTNPELILKLTKVPGGFNILNSSDLYLNTQATDESDDPHAGGTVYNPIYIDLDGYTRSTDIYSYNLMQLYVLRTTLSWGGSERNPYYDEIYKTYQNAEGVIGYSKNLIIPVISASKLIGYQDNKIRTGSILQWSNSTSSLINNIQLFGDNANNEFYIRSQSGEIWNDWSKIITSDLVYTKQEIDDLELVIARALTDLDSRLLTIEEGGATVDLTEIQEQIDTMDEVMSLALTNLDDRLTALESTDSVDLTEVWNRIDEIDLVTAASLNSINTRLINLENNQQNIPDDLLNRIVTLENNVLEIDTRLSAAISDLRDDVTEIQNQVEDLNLILSTALTQLNDDVSMDQLDSILRTGYLNANPGVEHITVAGIINYIYTILSNS